MYWRIVLVWDRNKRPAYCRLWRRCMNIWTLIIFQPYSALQPAYDTSFRFPIFSLVLLHILYFLSDM